MGPIQRAIRRALNPISTRVTMLVQGSGHRRVLRMGRQAARAGGTTYGWASASAPRPESRPHIAGVRAAPEAVSSGDVDVPDVVGLNWETARSVLHEVGLVAVGPEPDGPPLAALGWPDGVVVDQRPGPGTVLPAGSPVTIWIERGPGSAGDARTAAPQACSPSGVRDGRRADQRGGRLRDSLKAQATESGQRLSEQSISTIGY
jgi:hypothetical protein